MEAKVNVNFDDLQNEVIIRKGEAAPVHVRPSISIATTTIDGPREFLSKPLISYPIDFSLCQDEKGVSQDMSVALLDLSFVEYSIKARSIFLIYNSKAVDPVKVSGLLKLDTDLEEWGINSGKRMSSMELAQFVRMRRHFFETKEIALKLEKEFQNFKAKVDKEVEANDDKRGNVKFSLAQKVITSMPLEFTVTVPVFEGQPKVSVKVEIDIDPTDLTCSLVSPGLKEYIDQESEAIIMNEIQQIRELQPLIRIFRK
jgi:hypothetical protein